MELIIECWEFVYSVFFFLMIRRPPRSTQGVSSAASDVYKRQPYKQLIKKDFTLCVYETILLYVRNRQQLYEQNPIHFALLNQTPEYIKYADFIVFRISYLNKDTSRGKSRGRFNLQD
eukprot:TRINITY_DN27649_c0_g1_i2.p1 TRINITY_DN27649_c0_g1~~TRINITY_DN27649_c0_g1_i2.p1  ORF type:complete len:118 (-),score=8.25 TRINITY_DN27649_c0_g1_i2:222-575(-)